MTRPRDLWLILGVAFLLYWPLRGVKVAASLSPGIPVKPMATITYRLPAQSFKQSLFQLCEKLRCQGETDEAKVRWASDWLVKLASTWDWKDLSSLDVTVTVEVEE